MTYRHLGAGIVIGGCLASLAAAGDGEWSQFRGPNGSGVAVSASIPDELGIANLAWKTVVPGGYSSPVVAADNVFITAGEGTVLRTLCLDRTTGAVRWSRVAPVELERAPRGPNSSASPSPTTDGENVYVFFEGFGLISYDAEGIERWTLPLGPFNTPYGLGASPIIIDDTLLLLCDQDTDSFLLALDKDTGEERWKTGRIGATHGFATPVIHEPEAGPKEIVVSGSYRVTGYSLDDGSELWHVKGMAWQAKSTPVIHDGTLFVHSWMASPTEIGVKEVTTPWEEALDTYDVDDSGDFSKEEVKSLGLDQLWFLYDMNKDGVLAEDDWSYLLARAEAENGLYAIRLGGRGDITDQILWRYNRALPNIPSPLYYDGILYVLKEGGILTALNPATGERIKAERIEGAEDPYFASPIAASGRLMTASQAGNIAILNAGSEWELASLCAFDEDIWATPALVDGQVIVRTQEALYCFDAE